MVLDCIDWYDCMSMRYDVCLMGSEGGGGGVTKVSGVPLNI